MSFTRTLRAVGGTVMAGALLLSTAPAASADEIRDAQWPLKSFGAEELWGISTGKGITVAVIDDGVDPDHPDLKGNVLKGADFIGSGSGTPEGGDEHGTAMAGIIAGHGHGPNGSQGVKGLAPEAKILPIRDDGSTRQGYLHSIRYAVDHGASVINISQSGPEALEDEKIISYAWKKDVLIVAGTGNDGESSREYNHYPAEYPGVLAVGGVKNTGEIWENSNYGPETLLTAPATNIVTTGRSSKPSPYSKGSGTSNATAYVSATAALLRAKFPDLTAGQIANRMTKSAGLPASAKGLKIPDEKYGYGFVRPYAALTADIPPGPKSGPLKVPDLVIEEAKTAEKRKSSDSGGTSLRTVLPVLGVIALAVIALVVAVFTLKRKRRNHNTPTGGGPWSGSSTAPGHSPQGTDPYDPQASHPSGPPNQPPPGW